MTINRRDLVKIAGAGSVALAAGSSVGPGVFAQEAGTSELIIGKSAEAVGYDPALVTATSSIEFLAVVYERLVTFDEEGQPQ
ncbi:MAG: twin-arginine translocation signal domain-containing protein, partial [Chloroflexota bacterium]|nr:twin-arginine translocation signal domain-containing protein [Chloroflexota bacterium]